MRRTSLASLVTVVAAVMVAACGDRAPTPMSPLVSSTASLDRGNPPPPPVAGNAFMDFDIFSSEDASEAGTCGAEGNNVSVKFSYVFNKPENNAVLHLGLDGKGTDATVHQTDKKLDAHGTLTGTDFSFKIKDAVAGSIIDAETRFPFIVTFNLTGTLTNEFGTCNANAVVTVQLQSID